MTPSGGPEGRSTFEAGSLAVPPAPLRDPGGGRRSAAIALAAVVLAVAGAIALPMLLSGQPDPSAPTLRSGAALVPTVGPTTPTPPTKAPADASPEPATPGPSLPLPTATFNAHELAQVVESGELDGRLVLVRGNLESIDLPCDREPTAFHTCVMLAIEGVDAPVAAAWSTLPWHEDPAPGDYLAVVPDGGTLWYLGHVGVTLDTPSTIDGLTRALLRAQGSEGAPSRLFLVEGWLIMEPPVGCPSPRAPSATPCYQPGPFLADEEPVDGGVPRSRRGSNVVIGNGVGVDVEQAVIEGPFLVSMLSAEQCASEQLAPVCGGSGARWLVEARYDAGTWVYAHVP